MPSNYKAITSDNIRRRGEEFDDIGEFLARQLYSDRTHFVYELLQNAEDALGRRCRKKKQGKYSKKVSFNLYDDRLEFRHFGESFNEEDVRGISDILKGTKHSDFTQIGKFGIGFKSVYAFTSSPEVHSGDENFIIERFIRPKEVTPRDLKQGETLFVLPFNIHDVSAMDTVDKIGERLRNLGPRTLLFLNHIDEIEWTINSSEQGIYLKESVAYGDYSKVTLIGQNPEGDIEEEWLVFNRAVNFPNHGGDLKVEIAYKLEHDDKTGNSYIKHIGESPLYVYFPTEKLTHLGFLIQGPYQTISSRENITDDDPVNIELINETGILVSDSLSKLKEIDLLTPSLLEAMPIKLEYFPEEGAFRPIYDHVLKAFQEQNLLPTEGAGHTAARNAKLARSADLRNLLTGKQLTELYDSDASLEWLAKDITENKTTDLWHYLQKQLNVDVVTPDTFAREFSKGFISNQSDDWVISFYSFLSNHSDLWRIRTGHFGDQHGIIGNKEIIRLEKGEHVPPYGMNGKILVFLPPEEATSFPVVKRAIVCDDQALQFLKELGLTQPDLIDDVRAKVLSKYLDDLDPTEMDDEEHLQDVARIYKASKQALASGKKDFVDEIKDVYFLIGQNATNGELVFLKPADIYFRSSLLEEYFEDNDNAWFLHGIYDDKYEGWFRELGVVKNVRVFYLKAADDDFVNVCAHHSNHVRGHDRFDPDSRMDGLEEALLNPSVKKSSYICRLLGRVNIPIKGIVEYCSRQTWDTSRKEEKLSKIGKVLTNNAWLPISEDEFRKPCEITQDEVWEGLAGWVFLPESIVKQLGMMSTSTETIAKAWGMKLEHVEYFKDNPDEIDEFIQWRRERIASAKARDTEEADYDSNEYSERRKEKIRKSVDDAPQKEYQTKERSVRTSQPSIEKDAWLRNTYTNSDGVMYCQICNNEMPFKKRNGEYYFEAVELFGKDNIDIELEVLHIALCPLCAAKYKEFVKRVPNQCSRIITLIKEGGSPRIPILLGEVEAYLRFKLKHYNDLKVVLEEVLD